MAARRNPVRGRALSQVFRAVQKKLQAMEPWEVDDLARRADLSPATLYDWQTARVESPGIENLEKVAYLLRIKVTIEVKPGVVGQRKRKAAKGRACA
ncbi:helix-turn-helix domain-containing protein [Microbulbifer sp. PSTR4-B]|uniref:helix-turn-helix domain-containing protein n=1 Tax=unclassified Microbulbifer TaxID=2619833 RepID=UPI00403B25ED